MVNKSINVCRICGLIQDEAPWGKDGDSPSFDFCSCCGVEFGYQDCTPIAVRYFRKLWLEEGAGWLNANEKPTDWSLDEQLKNIPEEFK